VTERRRFSSQERVALYLAADGRCICGVELQPGWHADHVDPFATGGPTDVANGQALCPQCNLKKGSKTMNDLRAWQVEALERFLRRTDDFLCVATPGAGKTRFALTAATRLIERGDISRVVVVVPTSHLRTQWAQAAARAGVQLDPTFANAASVLASDYDGLVVTYAAVDAAAQLYRRISTHQRTLVILDEVHHAGEMRSWGESTRTAFASAARRLSLSGTPFRSDGRSIPFIQYDDELRSVADYTYDYADALGDQNNNVVRQIQFHAFDGEARWREASAVEKVRLSDVNEDTRSKALSSALQPDGAWIASVLRQADGQLSADRQTVPDAGGLVVARNQYDARRYADLLRIITGEAPALAISDEPDASRRITAFADSRSRWIVAVAMVSEGVDIPRLTVGVYATNVAAELFFRQVVGRFVRTRPSDEDEIVASLFIPSVQPLLGYAAEIERMIPKALEEAVERAERQRKDVVQLEINMVEPLAPSDAVHLATILAGERFAEAELRRAEEMARLAGMPTNVSAAHVARLLRMAGTPRQAVTTVEIPPVALVDEKRQLRRLLTSMVNRLHRLTDKPHPYIHADLNRICGTNTATADLAGLKQRLTLLDRWIAEAQP
jgi:superfamily II DNA or RNA helicase